MELIARRVLPSLIYIDQFHIPLYVVKSFETVKKSNRLYKMSFKSADFVVFIFKIIWILFQIVYSPSFQICFPFICVSMC